MGVEGGGEERKIFAQRKIKIKWKKIHARQLTPKKILANA